MYEIVNCTLLNVKATASPNSDRATFMGAISIQESKQGSYRHISLLAEPSGNSPPAKYRVESTQRQREEEEEEEKWEKMDVTCHVQLDLVSHFRGNTIRSEVWLLIVMLLHLTRPARVCSQQRAGRPDSSTDSSQDRSSRRCAAPPCHPHRQLSLSLQLSLFPRQQERERGVRQGMQVFG